MEGMGRRMMVRNKLTELGADSPLKGLTDRELAERWNQPWPAGYVGGVRGKELKAYEKTLPTEQRETLQAWHTQVVKTLAMLRTGGNEFKREGRKDTPPTLAGLFSLQARDGAKLVRVWHLPEDEEDAC